MRAPLVPLGDLCHLINGRAFKPTDWVDTGLPIVRIQNLRDPLKPMNKFDGEVQDRFLIDSGDVLLSWSGTPGTSFGCFVWDRGRAVLNQHIFRVECDSSIIERNFLVCAMNSKLDEMIDRAHGGVGLRHITKSELNKIKLPLPPLEEQRRIVAILNRAAKIERLRAQASERLQEFIPALFDKMFGDPVDNSMKWPKENLGALVAEFRYGTSRKCTAEKRAGDLPVLRIPNVVDGVVNWDDLKFRRFERREVESLRLRVGDILFVRTNGNPNYIGRCAVYVGNRSAAFASYLIRARLTGGNASPGYLADALALPSMRQILLRLARTTAGNYNISIRSLASLPVPLPPLDLQMRYERLAGKARELVLQAEVAATGAETLSSSVMAKLLASADNPEGEAA